MQNAYSCFKGIYPSVFLMENKTPNSCDEWLEISNQFFERWNFPHCIGAIDGRHCPIIQPQYTCTEYFNYKSFFSLVLLAIVDANYKFIYVNVGAQGSASDGGVFNNTDFKSDLDAGNLNLPQTYPLPGRTQNIPYVLVGDVAFALSNTLLKPFAGNHDETSPKRHFNNRLSRARTRVENVFGICSARFRVLRKPISLKVENAKLVILTACFLHNFIKAHVAENDDPVHVEILEESRRRQQEVREEENTGMQSLFHLRNTPRRASPSAKRIQQEFCDWCNSPDGAISFTIRDH